MKRETEFPLRLEMLAGALLVEGTQERRKFLPRDEINGSPAEGETSCSPVYQMQVDALAVRTTARAFSPGVATA